MRAFAAVVLALTVAGHSYAEDKLPPELLDALQTLLPGIEADRIALSPIPGVYEVTVGPSVVYLSEDGRYMMRGDVIDLESRRNLTNITRRGARLSAINKVGESSMIVFSPDNVKHTVTVFTDVDCPYCLRLHEQMADYHRYGIEIRYLAFPRAGIPSASYDKTVSVWCSDDPHTAIGLAKAGRPVPPKECSNPVKAHFDLGRSIGVTGTPAIVLDNGELVPGFVPARRLSRLLAGDRSS